VAELPPLESTLAPFQEGDVLEIDELWSFVLRRKNKRWLWLALAGFGWLCAVAHVKWWHL